MYLRLDSAFDRLPQTARGLKLKDRNFMFGGSEEKPILIATSTIGGFSLISAIILGIYIIAQRYWISNQRGLLSNVLRKTCAPCCDKGDLRNEDRGSRIELEESRNDRRKQDDDRRQKRDERRRGDRLDGIRYSRKRVAADPDENDVIELVQRPQGESGRIYPILKPSRPFLFKN